MDVRFLFLMENSYSQTDCQFPLETNTNWMDRKNCLYGCEFAKMLAIELLENRHLYFT
jgi:hypothetical protein